MPETLKKCKHAWFSFSTDGSAEHYRVDKVQEAVKIFSKTLIYDHNTGMSPKVFRPL